MSRLRRLVRPSFVMLAAAACGLPAEGILPTDSGSSTAVDGTTPPGDAGGLDAGHKEAAPPDAPGVDADTGGRDGGADAAGDTSLADASGDVAVADAPADVADESAVDAPADTSTPDSAPDATPDAAPDAAPDAGCQLTACPVAPTPAWSIVAFATTNAAACPAGFGPTDLLENPTLGSACACGTTCTATVDCGNATLVTTYGNACGTTGASIFGAGGGCTASVGSFGGPDFGATVAAVNAACTAPAPTPNPAAVGGRYDRICYPQATTCAGESCTAATAAAGYQGCLVASGDQTCPAGTTTKHLVGAADVVCGTCPCTATVACAGTVAFSASINCGGQTETFSTGTCEAVAGGTTFGSYKWTPAATQTPVCSVGQPSGASVTLDAATERTVCCP